MKKILFSAYLLLIAVPFINAQNALQQGAITYDMTINLREQVAKKNAALAAMVPKETHVYMTVTFKDGLFAVASEEVKSKEKTANTTLQISNNMDEKKIADLKKRTVRGEYTINNKKYYVAETLQPATAIMYTAETKKILGYNCTKAIVTGSDKKKYIAWFTTQLSYSYSPEADVFAGLKGTVLEYSTDDYTCRATAVNANGFKLAAVTPDAAARRITQEQLQDLQDDALNSQVQNTAPKGSGNNRQVTEKVMIKL